MRAGALDRTITIQRAAETRDGYGGASVGWTDLTTARAQLIQSSTAEFMEGGGEEAKRTVAFRVRWIEGLRNADRVLFDQQVFDVLEVKELGRRRGLELRCRAATS